MICWQYNTIALLDSRTGKCDLEDTSKTTKVFVILQMSDSIDREEQISPPFQHVIKDFSHVLSTKTLSLQLLSRQTQRPAHVSPCLSQTNQH